MNLCNAQRQAKFQSKNNWRDPATDLAVIKIESDKLQFTEFGNSDAVHIGEWVLAVGILLI